MTRVFVKRDARPLPIAVLATQTRSKQNEGRWYEAVGKAVYRKEADRQEYGGGCVVCIKKNGESAVEKAI